MSFKNYIFLFLFLSSLTIDAQNIHYYFVDDVLQRSYFNPALNNDKTFAVSSGLGLDFTTNGPSINDFIKKNENGGLLISASDAISEMDDINDILGYSSVNTFDASLNTPFVRISIGHAWKANGWMEYSKNLAEFITFGNGPFVGEQLNLSPQINYINYNEVYLGLQKNIGPLSLGVNIKRLNGVEAIKTGNHKIDLTTSDDIYQLNLETDFEMYSSRAFTYTDLDDFDLNIENFSFDNFFSGNGGWAFDVGAAITLSDRLELSLSILDIGSISWDVDPKKYISQNSQSFDGIDVGKYITSDDELLLTDSLKSLLRISEFDEAFTTTLATQIYLGGRLKISDLWTVGAILQTKGSGDRRSSILGLNATARIYKWLNAGVLYSARSGNYTNIGLSTSMQIGPVIGFLSTDNIFRIGSFKSTNSNLRAGLSLRI